VGHWQERLRDSEEGIEVGNKTQSSKGRESWNQRPEEQKREDRKSWKGGQD
jgi:hypothetical protein